MPVSEVAHGYLHFDQLWTSKQTQTAHTEMHFSYECWYLNSEGVEWLISPKDAEVSDIYEGNYQSRGVWHWFWLAEQLPTRSKTLWEILRPEFNMSGIFFPSNRPLSSLSFSQTVALTLTVTFTNPKANIIIWFVEFGRVVLPDRRSTGQKNTHIPLEEKDGVVIGQ